MLSESWIKSTLRSNSYKHSIVRANIQDVESIQAFKPLCLKAFRFLDCEFMNEIRSDCGLNQRSDIECYTDE